MWLEMWTVTFIDRHFRNLCYRSYNTRRFVKCIILTQSYFPGYSLCTWISRRIPILSLQTASQNGILVYAQGTSNVWDLPLTLFCNGRRCFPSYNQSLTPLRELCFLDVKLSSSFYHPPMAQFSTLGNKEGSKEDYSEPCLLLAPVAFSLHKNTTFAPNAAELWGRSSKLCTRFNGSFFSVY
jgi:hypothetical protein